MKPIAHIALDRLTNEVALRSVTVIDGAVSARATRRHRHDRRARSETVLLTMGKLNYRDRQYVARHGAGPHIVDRAWPKRTR